MEGFSISFLIFSLLYTQKMTNAVDIITETQFIKDGQTIVSSDGTFEMGFFSPGNSMNRYVGIWYHKQLPVRTVVWVANRKIPLTDESGVLKIIKPAILVILNATSSIIWSSNASRSTAQNPVAQLSNLGNLVVREANDDNILWQSFDYPTDTLLPGMKLGKNFVTGLETSLSSWKSNDDPAPGDYTYHLDPSGFPQAVLKKGSVVQFRNGPWNGVSFSGSNLKQNSIYTFEFVFNEKEVYYRYQLISSSVLSRFLLNQTGFTQRWMWQPDQEQGWFLYLYSPKENCDIYSLCGPYGRCKVDDFPICGCLDKFVPEYQEGGVNFSKGCARKTPLELDCRNGQGDGDVFLKYSEIKLPDARSSWFDRSMNLEECKSACLKNCSCTAYTNLDIRGDGSGCWLWFGDLLDMRVFATGQDIYIRMASSELGYNSSTTAPQSGSERKKAVIIGVSISLLVVIILLGLGLTMYVQKKKTLYLKREGRQGHDFVQHDIAESRKEDVELPLFGLSTIANATNNFSIENKLGEGGFGPVYKGVLQEGQEIAVKRLSKTSNQGLDEFKNEVICIAKLQHRNLVKLLGCCIQGEEKMLIYEYMPNKSLDKFIFAGSRLLDWPKRFHIINGIARGLLYLHQDSRLRIIHRDLKASNVLLDFDMNPKISDFGMARSFGGNETAASTKRVVGTYGYMSPEYAVDGIFSVKSDVFSFGVLVLEIVSGKRNRGFTHCDHHHNLLGHAWRLYNEGGSLELMDATVAVDDSRYICEVLLSIQVGLLCVQQCPEDRPSMSSVVLMLGSERALPRPKQPGFFTERSIFEANCSSSSYALSSNNEITITLLNGR